MAVFSSGVLLKNPNTVLVHTDVVNLDPNDNRTVAVQVFNWSGAVPASLSSVGLVIPPINRRETNVTLANVTHYEVRVITGTNDPDLLFNTFGVNRVFTPQEGNTVLYKEFNVVEFD